jgi:TRAP-type C4-dicarboxylate transport system substrate-binding protein
MVSITGLRLIVGAAVLSAAVASGLAISPASAQKITLKIGHPLTATTGLQKWAEFFKEDLEKRAPGKFDVKIFPTSQLGSIPRMIEGAQLGTIEMIEIPPAFFTGLDERFGIVTAPGIFNSLEHGQRTLHDPEFRKAFWPIGEAKGLKMVGMTCDTASDYATVTPIRKIADFKGRKIRVFGSPIETEIMRRVGATGVPMPLTEVIPAIQRKVIDGNKAGIVVFVPFKYQSVAKYVFKAKQSWICLNKMASKSWFDGLSPDMQKAVLDAAAEADKQILPWSIALEGKMYDLWTKGGGVLTELSPEEHEELRKKLATVGDDVYKNKPEVLKMFTLMKEVAARTAKK